MDLMVQRAQDFVNQYRVDHGLTTSQIPYLEPTGQTGWPVMRGLTRVLQHLLGITSLADSFGPATLAALTSQYPVVTDAAPSEVCKVLQSALYCKGYDGGGIDGILGPVVDGAVASARSNMGLPATGGVVPKVFKALLNMDAYIVVNGGDPEIRGFQQWLNGRYVGRRDFFVGPCDGWFSRDVQKSVVLAIQFELGMSDDKAIGVFGPSTQEGVRDHTITVGTSGVWASLFTGLLVCNRRPGASFTSTFTSAHSAIVSTFQSFAALPVTGTGNYQTWASLIVSKGDETRIGTACDTSTPLTATSAAALKTAGYQVVGRYLTNTVGGTLDKKLRQAEIAAILGAGLRIFPIYQTTANYLSYFSNAQGKTDAWAAINAMQEFGFKSGTRVYFAVDFDAYDQDVTDAIIPHFQGIKSVFDRAGGGYQIGIYGARNVCTRVAHEGLSTGSFMLDMSTAYSGNMGVPHCADWTFDQISSRTVGGVGIDNNISSGRDAGQSSFNTPRPARLDVDCGSSDWTSIRPILVDQIRQYNATIGKGDFWAPIGSWYSIDDCVVIIQQHDALITDLARQYEMRKALIQCVLFRELFCYGGDDPLADAAAEVCYFDNQYNANANPKLCESTRGLPQCKPSTSIAARNYCAPFSGESPIDATTLAANYQEWLALADDDYAISRIPLIHFYDAFDEYQIARLELQPPESIIQGVISRYNGFGPAAATYGEQTMAIYRIYEQQNAALRAR